MIKDSDGKEKVNTKRKKSKDEKRKAHKKVCPLTLEQKDLESKLPEHERFILLREKHSPQVPYNTYLSP